MRNVVKVFPMDYVKIFFVVRVKFFCKLCISVSWSTDDDVKF